MSNQQWSQEPEQTVSELLTALEEAAGAEGTGRYGRQLTGGRTLLAALEALRQQPPPTLTLCTVTDREGLMNWEEGKTILGSVSYDHVAALRETMQDVAGYVQLEDPARLEGELAQQWLALVDHDPEAAYRFYDQHELFDVLGFHWEAARHAVSLPFPAALDQAFDPGQNVLVQAVRLLGELVGVGGLSTEQREALCAPDAMDCTPELLDQVLGSTSDLWDDLKLAFRDGNLALALRLQQALHPGPVRREGRTVPD